MWAEVLTIIGVNIALIAILATLMIWVVNKLDGDVKAIGTRMDSFDRRMDAHAQRIDQLYKMFVDLLKGLK